MAFVEFTRDMGTTQQLWWSERYSNDWKLPVRWIGVGCRMWIEFVLADVDDHQTTTTPQSYSVSHQQEYSCVTSDMIIPKRDSSLFEDNCRILNEFSFKGSVPSSIFSFSTSKYCSENSDS
ncbi:hypothetical protein PV328_009669 [Microctonus aethiopoides]|uniref:Uncharacterized protein n=1 Tax=Microctonus aethiopoides TaxID=144406 RepID=A0AA39C6D7_9HYME|nr:hypothetical protein PV328_009669 [Microctonus aethiopoides]